MAELKDLLRALFEGARTFLGRPRGVVLIDAGVMMMRSAFQGRRLGILWKSPCSRGAAPRWDDRALERAGEESFPYEVAPAFPAQAVREPVLTIPLRGTPPLNKLSRFEVLEEAPMKLGERVEILEWPGNDHEGGDLQWGPREGCLYLSAGDGSAPGDPDNIGQHVEEIRESILRIDVHHAEGARGYRIPDDTPCVGMNRVRPELWCYGLRNARR